MNKLDRFATPLTPKRGPRAPELLRSPHVHNLLIVTKSQQSPGDTGTENRTRRVQEVRTDSTGPTISHMPLFSVGATQKSGFVYVPPRCKILLFLILYRIFTRPKEVLDFLDALRIWHYILAQ